MTGKKDSFKQDLAYLYELPEFKNFKSFLENERLEIATRMGTIGRDKEVGKAEHELFFLQGQAHALKQLWLELTRIHKEHLKNQELNKKANQKS